MQQRKASNAQSIDAQSDITRSQTLEADAKNIFKAFKN